MFGYITPWRPENFSSDLVKRFGILTNEKVVRGVADTALAMSIWFMVDHLVLEEPQPELQQESIIESSDNDPDVEVSTGLLLAGLALHGANAARRRVQQAEVENRYLEIVELEQMLRYTEDES